MLDNLEKNWRELLALLLGGGIFTFLGSLLNQMFNRNKLRSEATKNDKEAEKAEAEADLARARFMAETQEALTKMSLELQSMRERNDATYEAREKERDAREKERDSERDDKRRMRDELSSLSAMNVSLNEQVRQQTQANFERELVSQQRISDLEKRVSEQGSKVDVIEMKTGSLEDKMPKHA